MGLFEWRRKDKAPSPDIEDFNALMSEMTKEGVVIVTRDNGSYTVYWARRQSVPLAKQETIADLKRSVEGKGPTALAAILDCKDKAARPRTGTDGQDDAGPARTVVRTTTTTQTETHTEGSEGVPIKPEMQPPRQATEQTPPPSP